MTHDEIQTELAAFALGTLDAREREEVARHLDSGCDACRAVLEEWQIVVADLALACEAEPPSGLRNRLMAHVGPSAASGSARARRSLAFPLALAASLLLALGWAAREWMWRQRWSSTSAEVTQLRSALTAERSRTQELAGRLAGTEEELSRVRTALAQLEESLDLLHDPRLQLVTLSHPERAQPAVAHVLVSAESGKALFSAVNLPPLPGDRTYELWWITADEGPINAGLFQPDPTGRARLEPQLPVGKGKIQAAAVTIEPAGGVPKPTGPMVLLGKL